PHEAAACEGDYLQELRRMLKDEKCVAVGEIGLDYHYDFSPRDIQLRFFEEQIVLAGELGLPIIVHDRESHEDTLNLLKKHRPKGVVHCFSGSAEMAKEVLKLGMYIGLGGAVTFKNARKPLEVAAVVPDDRLLIETDCPYMTPVPFRGRRNDSSFIPYAAEVLAQVKNTSAEAILEMTKQNANTLFGTEY
ncbi:MAG: TatD family hydrolase, partial [Clostridia bacterium]|nr:TatD family hydrolase [Clostridia bacterium]